MHSAQRINLYEIRESENAFRKSLEKFPHFIFTVRRVDVHAFHGRPAASGCFGCSRPTPSLIRAGNIPNISRKPPYVIRGRLIPAEYRIVDSSKSLTLRMLQSHRSLAHTVSNGLANALPVERQSEHIENGIRLLWK